MLAVPFVHAHTGLDRGPGYAPGYDDNAEDTEVCQECKLESVSANEIIHNAASQGI